MVVTSLRVALVALTAFKSVVLLSSNALKLGTNESATGGWYTGSSDEPLIENTAWSAEKVKKYYTMAKGRFGII